MKFDHQGFSKSMKIELGNYLFEPGSEVLQRAKEYLKDLQKLRLDTLQSDKQKTAFWVNVYNAFTNYQIVHNGLKKSVWEKPDFFTDRSLKIGNILFSLDDIENGILRRNGERRNSKPLQFDLDNPRLTLMVDTFDFRIHFALNCGSISCPAIAFYSEDNLNEELDRTTKSFAEEEFVVNHKVRTITCSQLFVWYKKDFGNLFLNDPNLSHYRVIERPYQWKIK